MVIASYATARADFYHNPPSIRFSFIHFRANNFPFLSFYFLVYFSLPFSD